MATAHTTPTVTCTSIVALAFALAGACGSNDASNIDPIAYDAIANYAEIVHTSYSDSLAEAKALEAAVQALVTNPTADTLTAARTAWLQAREPYLQTEVYRFYDGPIDEPNAGPEGMINAWPLAEAYIDYTVDKPTVGIINDPTLEISAAALESLNQRGAENNVATGYHAIEFLLWGQDWSKTGPGNRPHTDFVLGGATAANPDRRRLYLATTATLLVGHLEYLVDKWAPNATNYRSEFAAVTAKEGLRRILTGMIVLTGFETGGERLQTALLSQDQEDEHSCFSDNTHRDMIQDVQGIHNVWHGSYKRLDSTQVSGAGIRAVVAKTDLPLTKQIDEQLADCLALADALVPPFDQEILTPAGRKRISNLVDALQTLEAQFEKAFRLFDLTIPKT